jgi:hypothetical protein
MKPTEPKLFVDIHLADHPKNLCDGWTLPAIFAGWFVCKTKYEMEIKRNEPEKLRGDFPNDFFDQSATVPPNFVCSMTDLFGLMTEELVPLTCRMENARSYSVNAPLPESSR